MKRNKRGHKLVPNKLILTNLRYLSTDGEVMYNFHEMRTRNDEIESDVQYEPDVTKADINNEALCDWNSPSSYFELNNSSVGG